MIYLRLFLSFIQVGLFSIGGGYATMPLIQNQVVDINHWLTMNEFIDLITISQMTPGPIAVNSATFVGIKIAGVPGALIATAGCILPSFFIVSVLAYIYYNYKSLTTVQNILICLRPAVVALIASAGFSVLYLVLWDSNSISINNIQWINSGIFIISFGLLRKFHWNPIYVILISGFTSLCANLVLA